MEKKHLGLPLTPQPKMNHNNANVNADTEDDKDVNVRSEKYQLGEQMVKAFLDKDYELGGV